MSDKRKLRSRDWFGRADFHGFLHRGWLKNQGWPADLFEGKPVVGICNTWSELTPCNGHFRELAECVKRGVWEAGGFPLEFPVMSLGETQMRPTAMLFRNLASMDVEESIRANPIDGVVLMMGCDKTTPALLMGAASCNLPALAVSGGPMLNGRFRGRTIGSGTGVWQMSEEVRAGSMTQEEFTEAESCMNRSRGHCMTMGTASTMASMVESLGMGLPHNAAIPAVDARRQVLAHLYGPQVVSDVVNAIVNQTLPQALSEKQVQPVNQPQVEAGMAVVQDRRRGRHDRAERRRERRQPQPPGPQPGENHELVLGRVEAADDLDRPLGQQPARVGQADAAPGPLDQLGARFRLEPRQVVADGGLRVVQRVGGCGQGR